MKVNNKEFEEIRLLGKGKGGYSYLVKDENNNFFVFWIKLYLPVNRPDAPHGSTRPLEETGRPIS